MKLNFALSVHILTYLIWQKYSAVKPIQMEQDPLLLLVQYKIALLVK